MTRREWVAPGVLIALLTMGANFVSDWAVQRVKGDNTASALRDLRDEVQKQSGDQRSTREALDRLGSDVAAIRSQVRDPAVIDLEIKNLADAQLRDKADTDIKILKIIKWQEDATRSLIKKGIIE